MSMLKASDPANLRPRYREAYPRLNIMHATAALAHGHSICQFTNQWGGTVGLARIAVSGDRCQLEYEIILPASGHHRSWDEFKLRSSSNGIGQTRTEILCSVCETNRKSLFFVDKWACPSCHDLNYRSQLIHPLVQKWERVDELAAVLKFGKPHRVQNETFEKQLAELEEMKMSLQGKKRKYASAKYTYFVEADWRAAVKNDEFLLAGIMDKAQSLSK